MKSASGAVLYVGKARSLRSRVRSYFQSGADLSPRKKQMVAEVADIETIVTDSELEALILESNLIKKHRPTYNVRLRDDKSYPYIAVTLSEAWPRFVFMRKLRMQPKEKDKYYGPYTDSEAVKETLKLIRRVFRVPCGYKDPGQSKGRPCLYYHIGQCTGVCCGRIGREEYMAVVRDAMAFLEGRREQLVDRLVAQMEAASEKLEFEKAARIRDQIQAIQTLIARQKVVSSALEDQDVVALVTDNGNAVAQMFFIRGGKLIGQEHFMLENASADELSLGLQEFIKQYYTTAPYVPREVLLAADIDEMDIIEAWLRRRRGSKVSLVNPKRGEKKKLVEMTLRNAELVLQQIKAGMEADDARIAEQLSSLKDALNLPSLPERIEAYDVSNIQGSAQVGSLVVFENGRPKKEHYRKFRIRRQDGIPDDYASMKEIVSRRITGRLRQTDAFRDPPDLMLIDGGRGQLNAALEAVAQSGEPAPQWAVIGIAKQREEIFLPDRPGAVLLPRDSRALHLIQRIRDEAHRFAVTYHRDVRGKGMRVSVLNQIPGIGPKRRRALMRHFGAIDKIRGAGVEELMQVQGMTRAAAESVRRFFEAKSNAENSG